MHARLPALVVLVSVLAVPPSAAQSAEGRGPTDAPVDTSTTAQSALTASTSIASQAFSPNRLRVWGGGSFATGGPIGNVPRAQLRLLGLRYEHLLVPSSLDSTPKGPTLTYTVDVLPILHLTIPPRAISIPPLDDESSTRNRGLATYGVGISPAGLRMTYRITKRVQPFVGGSTSITYFTASVPAPRGKPLNFMFDLGAGVQVILTPDLLLTVGYRYHHLSNGFRGQINPGVDANLLHFGVGISR